MSPGKQEQWGSAVAVSHLDAVERESVRNFDANSPALLSSMSTRVEISPPYSLASDLCLDAISPDSAWSNEGGAPADDPRSSRRSALGRERFGGHHVIR